MIFIFYYVYLIKFLDLKKYEHRYDSLEQELERRQSNSRGFLIAGYLDEKNFTKKWQEKVN